MNRQEFLRRLSQNLVIGAEEKEEVMLYYTEYFEEAGPENEQAVLEELGDPVALAAKLNAECASEDDGKMREEPEQTASSESDFSANAGNDFEYNEALREAEAELREAECELREAIDEAEMELREAEIDVREAEIDVDEAKNDVEAATVELEAAKAERDMANVRVEVAKGSVNAILVELQKLSGTMAEEAEERLNEAEQSLEEAEDVLAEMEDAVDEAEDALRDAKETLRDAEQTLKDAEREERNARREVSRVRREGECEVRRAQQSVEDARRDTARSEANADYTRERSAGREWRQESYGFDRELRAAEKEIRTVFTSLRDILGNSNAEKELHQFTDLDMEPFHTIRVEVENCAVTVLPSENDRYGVDAKYFTGDPEEWEINVVDGTLTIKKHLTRRFRIQFGFSGNREKNSEYVRIYLPQVAMDIVELITSNAEIRVDCVSAQTLIADTSNARIQIDNAKVLNELKADSSNGMVSLSKVEGETIIVDTSNGAVSLENVTGRTLNADTSNGTIRANFCDFTEQLHADTSNGSIEVLLYGCEQEFNIHADTSNAKIHVDGQVKGSEYNTRGGKKDVWLDTSNGRIMIGFTE